MATLIIFLMASSVLFTINTTRRLHRPHNIFVANLMITDMIVAVLFCAMSAIMTIGYAIRAGDFICCNVYYFLFHPIVALHFTMLMISVDKVIAFRFPFKHKRIMTTSVTLSICVILWPLSMPHLLFNNDDYVEVPEYGICTYGNAFVETITTYATPVFMETIITMSLNVYLAIKAYQVHKQIQKETRLSGSTSQVEALKRKQHKLKHHIKPIKSIKTLLVILFRNYSIDVLFLTLYIPGEVLINPTAYHNIMDYIIVPNVTYTTLLLDPFVYGLYFKQVREPMIRVSKRLLCMYCS